MQARTSLSGFRSFSYQQNQQMNYSYTTLYSWTNNIFRCFEFLQFLPEKKKTPNKSQGTCCWNMGINKQHTSNHFAGADRYPAALRRRFGLGDPTFKDSPFKYCSAASDALWPFGWIGEDLMIWAMKKNHSCFGYIRDKRPCPVTLGIQK